MIHTTPPYTLTNGVQAFVAPSHHGFHPGVPINCNKKRVRRLGLVGYFGCSRISRKKLVSLAVTQLFVGWFVYTLICGSHNDASVTSHLRGVEWPDSDVWLDGMMKMTQISVRPLSVPIEIRPAHLPTSVKSVTISANLFGSESSCTDRIRSHVPTPGQTP